MLARLSLAPLVLTAALSAEMATAIPVTWELGGETYQVLGSPSEVSTLRALGVRPGVPISVTITFETSTPDTDPNTSRGFYGGAVLDMIFQVGGWTATLGSTEPSNMTVRVPRIGDLKGQVTFSGVADQAPVVINDPSRFTLRLEGWDGPWSDAIPTDPAALGDWEQNGYSYLNETSCVGAGCTPGRVEFFIRSAELVSIPEPDAATLVALSIAALALRRMAIGAVATGAV